MMFKDLLQHIFLEKNSLLLFIDDCTFVMDIPYEK